MDNNFNNYSNGDGNFGNNMENTQNSNLENEGRNAETAMPSGTANMETAMPSGTANMETAMPSGAAQESAASPGNVNTSDYGSSTGASGSIYSYSYVNQENQERNPNYYERQEESGSAQRTYTTGSYGSTQPGYNTDGNAWNANSTDTAQTANQASWTDQGAGQNPNANGKKAKKTKKEKKPGEKKQHGFGMTMAKCAALALVFGLVSGTVFYGTGFAFRHTSGTNQAQQQATAESTDKKAETAVSKGNLPATGVSTAAASSDVSDVAENVMPSIVSITNMSSMVQPDFFGRIYEEEVPSAGSGIIIGQTEEEIYVATNNHVVSNSNQLTVNFVDNQQVTAEIKGTDASTDLAVLSVKTKDIPSDTMEKIKVATIGSSDSIKVGQSVVAIGNAMGYGQSVTTGVISALDREVTVQDEMTGTSITNDLIQTDAAINPGNSGGALLNMNGEVIGINSVKYADTQVEGMGYAIPISAAEPIINNLITREVVDESNSAYLGVTGQDVTSEISDSFGMPEGLYITMVTENSAADQAGIRKGDVLTKFDGRKITSLEGLSEAMKYYAAGTQVEVTLQKNDNGEWREETVTVTLGKKVE